MFCNRCGQRLPPAAAVCAQCGQPVPAAATAAPGAAPPFVGTMSPPEAMAPVKSRVERHLTVMAVLLLVFGLLRLPGGLLVFGMSHLRGPWGGWMGMPLGGIAGAFLGVIGLWLLAGAVLAIVAGVGLLQRAPWARVTAIIAAFVFLPGFPLDTALGIYVLIILMGQPAARDWAALAAGRSLRA